MPRLYITIITATTFLSGCATMKDSMLVGGAVGATAGGFVGNQASNHDAKGTAIGALIGAATGTLFGYLGHKDQKRREEERQAQLNAIQGKPKYPSVSTPQVRAVWVPDKIENDQFISGHYIYVIDKPATFRKE